MKNIRIVNANIVNEGQVQAGELLIKQGRIEKIGASVGEDQAGIEIIDAKGAFLLPGAIDDQVHFREPGLTHKADLYTESRAAAAGGVTSFMEMPNTNPQTLTQELLEEKFGLAKKKSLVNYSFFMGASNDNLEHVLKTPAADVCGVKVFMGSSTGNMLVDNEKTLEGIFSKVEMLIATHCEKEEIIRANEEKYKAQYGEQVPIACHPEIRDAEACYASSSLAVDLAKKHGARLHVLHISTARELALFDASLPIAQRKITAEACIHHLWFTDADYADKGAFIKWNPAVKSASDREAIRKAVASDLIAVVATDHAPHTLEEKGATSYFKTPSGGPLVQHSVVAMMEMARQGHWSVAHVAKKMAHDVADLFRIENRGYIREGYFADLVIVAEKPWEVERKGLLSKCGWSPFEGQHFNYQVQQTLVNGSLVYDNGALVESDAAMRLKFRLA